MTGHKVISVERDPVIPRQWRLLCDCGDWVIGKDAVDCWRGHDLHVIDHQYEVSE
jgi:hypothetical protein